ncbi:MAG: hypothetical protein OEW59_07265, partial [Gammaproteobacteria bacterium]|nr:hypothetical protein [Gammaproteobacteria bacterium]
LGLVTQLRKKNDAENGSGKFQIHGENQPESRTPKHTTIPEVAGSADDLTCIFICCHSDSAPGGRAALALRQFATVDSLDNAGAIS